MLAAIDNWIFVLLVVIVSLLRWVATRANKSKREQEQQQQPPRRRVPENQPRRIPPLSDEEQIRKFLEALGQPPTAKPPPPVPPRTDVAPRPVAPIQPPASPIPMPQLRRARKVQPHAGTAPPVTVVRQERPSAGNPEVIIERRYEAGPAEAAVFEMHETAVSLPEVTPALKSPPETASQISAGDQQQGLVNLLRSPAGLRDAILLREILGSPRGVQPFEFSAGSLSPGPL